MTRGLFATLFAFLTLVSSLAAQTPFRVITRPKIPTTETLERLNLAFGWHARVPLESPRDSLVSVQVMPRGLGEKIVTDIVAQTATGVVYLFDGETGALRWNTPVGDPVGSVVHPVAANERSIIVIRRDTFYVLNRDNGVHRVYKKTPEGAREFGYRLDGIPIAAPNARGDFLAFSYFDRVVCFLLPDFEAIASAKYKEPEIIAQEKEGSLQPVLLWTYLDPTMKLTTPPAITPSQVAIAASNGKVFSLRFGDDVRERVRYEFRTLAGISAAPGTHGDLGYIGGEDFFLYALDFKNSRLAWRFASGAPIRTKPEVNDADVFIVSEGRGMYRVHRFTGASYWLDRDANRFLAAHYHKTPDGKFKLDRIGRILARYVYAVDRQGRFLILDGDRGGVLGHVDASAWQLMISNEWTDRVYFANLDGQILSLRPRDSLRPQVNRSVAPPAKYGQKDDAPAPAAPPKTPDMMPERMPEPQANLRSIERDDVRRIDAPAQPPALNAFAKAMKSSRDDLPAGTP